jgi:CheY-like chemotaxis protein
VGQKQTDGKTVAFCLERRPPVGNRERLTGKIPLYLSRRNAQLMYSALPDTESVLAAAVIGYNGSMHGDEEPKGPIILVVEDDEDAREAMIALLQMKGYRAVPAGNGREALDYLDQASAPDLIILDLWMPVMDGWHFRSEQIRNPRLAHIPVIVVTALSDRADVDANEIIIKPVDVDRLLTTVDQYCRREPTS